MAYKPTKKLFDQVELMAGFGIPQADIAEHIDVSVSTLAKHYRPALKKGMTKANLAVMNAFFQNAQSGNVTAQIFWLKSRCGWKEDAQADDVGDYDKLLVKMARLLPD